MPAFLYYSPFRFCFQISVKNMPNAFKKLSESKEKYSLYLIVKKGTSDIMVYYELAALLPNIGQYIEMSRNGLMKPIHFLLNMARYPRFGIPVKILLIGVALAGCTAPAEETTDPVPLEIPHGYLHQLEIETDGRLIRFGPFVGYYFKPENPKDLTRLRFVCFNERGFYSSDMPENAKLFEGDAVLQTLEKKDVAIPESLRINPIFFPDAPEAWRNARPEPKEEYLHFHSCHDAGGHVWTGYWLRHVATAAFTYDMGGRVGAKSPLYHQLKPGVDTEFARIIEFDRGPEPSG